MLEGAEQQWFFRAGLVFLVFGPLALILLRYSAATAGVFGAICGLGLILVSLNNIQSFGFGILKAEMRAEIGNAKATIEQVRALAGDLSQIVLGTVQASGRLGGIPRQERFVIRANVVKSLSQLGLTPEQIKDATSKFDLYTDLDLRFDLMKAIFADTPDLKSRAIDIEKCLSIGNDDIQRIASADAKTCLEVIAPLGPESAERFKDFEAFQATRELRRPEIFFSRQ